MANLLSLVSIAIAFALGGWEWALLGGVVHASLWRVDRRVASVQLTAATSFVWLGLFHWNGDRRLFFPYAMQIAVQMAYLMQGRVPYPQIIGGGGIVALFLVIRLRQSATAGVLILEMFVALAILPLVLRICGSAARGPWHRALAGVLGSALAFAGLAV